MRALASLACHRRSQATASSGLSPGSGRSVLRASQSRTSNANAFSAADSDRSMRRGHYRRLTALSPWDAPRFPEVSLKG